MTDERLVLAGLGDLDRWVTLAEVPPFRFGIRKCSAEEKEILEHAKRKVTIRRLAWGQGGLTPSRLRAVYALLASGVLQDSERPEMVAQPVVQMETSTFLLSALQRRPDPTAGDAIRQEVDEELRRSANLDREKWLRVSRSAPRDQLARALEEKMERYHALLEAVGDDETLRTDIELILGRAASMLRLARQTTAPPAPARPAAPARPEASAAAPASVPAPPQPPRPVPAAPEPPAAEEAVEQPASVASPAEEPLPAIEEIAIGVAPAAPELPGGEASVSATEPRIAGDVERLLVEGSVKMTVGDYANAVRTYVKLCELEPNVAGYRVRLAVAMACYPRTAKSAERQFLEAIRLDPNNADIHFQFGIYYKAMKVRSRAVAELRTAVSLNPRHKQARAELEALAPKDSALTSLKKLFR
jgi:tetratricopeptide (TPR) repeat protein